MKWEVRLAKITSKLLHEGKTFGCGLQCTVIPPVGRRFVRLQGDNATMITTLTGGERAPTMYNRRLKLMQCL